MLSYILLIVNYLKLAWNLLLRYTLFPNIHDMQEYQQQQQLPGLADRQLGIVRCKSNQQQQRSIDQQEEVTCAVCLCDIEEDDEMRDLSCNHLFHKVCLDRWLGYSLSLACPICRTTFLTPLKLVADVQVLTINYVSFSSNHRDNWWLR